MSCKRTVRAAAGLAIACAFAGTAFGAHGGHAWIGTWVLDPQQSACEGTTNVQRYALTLTEAPGGTLDYRVEGLDSNQPVHVLARQVADGTPAPLTGLPGYADTLTLHRSRSQLHLLLSNHGQLVERATLVLGKDRRYWIGHLTGVLRGQPWVCRWLARRE